MEKENITGDEPSIRLVERERNRYERRCCGAGGGVKAGRP